MTAEAAPLILHVFATFAVGGPQVRSCAIINGLGPRYRHAIVAMDGNYGAGARLAPELDVTYPIVKITKGDTLRSAWRFRRILTALRPDVLVTSNWGSLEWAIANFVPITRHIHMEDGFGPEEAQRQLPRRVLTRRMVLRRSTVVLPSRNLLGIARDQWRLRPETLRFVPNGIDLRRFVNRPHDERRTGLVIGTVAAIRREKNLPRLLRAFRAIADQCDARLVIAGDGPELPGLRDLARELAIGERVNFTGHLAAPEAVYASFDVFALSSDTEQMPFSVLEAMATGLPVVATDVGDVRHMVAAENQSLLVPRDADDALAGKLREIVEATEARRRIGLANRAKAVREFDQLTMIETWRRLYAGENPGFQ